MKSADSSPDRYGFVGLGLMGRRMIRRLAAHASAPVVAWNRTPLDTAHPNVHLLETPEEAAAGSDVLFLMLSNADATESVLHAPKGLVAGLRDESVVVNCATIGPEAARRCGSALAARGIDYVDAPVLGSREAAADGKLVFLVGGETSVIQRCEPALRWMGRDVWRLGRVGSASAAKLVFNSLLGAGMAVLSDAFQLGDALGLPRWFLLDRVLSSPVVPAALQGKRGHLETRVSDTQFALRWMRKDLRLALGAAAQSGLAVPSIAAAEETFAGAETAGFGDRDFSEVDQHRRNAS